LCHTSACLAVVTSKDNLIREFHNQMKEKDDTYVKLLKQQQEDIATLLDRMHQQFALMQKTYDEELGNIEKAYMEERKTTILANKKGVFVFDSECLYLVI
jgi:hypothetical protein